MLLCRKVVVEKGGFLLVLGMVPLSCWFVKAPPYTLNLNLEPTGIIRCLFSTFKEEIKFVFWRDSCINQQRSWLHLCLRQAVVSSLNYSVKSVLFCSVCFSYCACRFSPVGRKVAQLLLPGHCFLYSPRKKPGLWASSCAAVVILPPSVCVVSLHA